MDQQLSKATKPAVKDQQSSEIRKHYYLDRYVVIAPKRNMRPDSFKYKDGLHKTETSQSPHIEAEEALLEIPNPNGSGWAVKVVDNRFPALSLDNPNAYGKHEMVVETPKHNVEFSELPVSHIQLIFEAYVRREATLRRIHGIQHVTIFKNDGPKAGASLAHAHSQILAWPFIPPDIVLEARAIEEYSQANGTCPHCDIVAWERQQSVRVVFEDKNFVAISPYASRMPFGLWFMPKRHLGSLAELSHDEQRSLASILKNCALRLDASAISFNFYLQNSLPGYNHHFVLQIEPRTAIWAGNEYSTGVIINPVSPEYAAGWYKNA